MRDSVCAWSDGAAFWRFCPPLPCLPLSPLSSWLADNVNTQQHSYTQTHTDPDLHAHSGEPVCIHTHTNACTHEKCYCSQCWKMSKWRGRVSSEVHPPQLNTPPSSPSVAHPSLVPYTSPSLSLFHFIPPPSAPHEQKSCPPSASTESPHTHTHTPTSLSLSYPSRHMQNQSTSLL